MSDPKSRPVKIMSGNESCAEGALDHFQGLAHTETITFLCKHFEFGQQAGFGLVFPLGHHINDLVVIFFQPAYPFFHADLVILFGIFTNGLHFTAKPKHGV